MDYEKTNESFFPLKYKTMYTYLQFITRIAYEKMIILVRRQNVKK